MVPIGAVIACGALLLASTGTSVWHEPQPNALSLSPCVARHNATEKVKHRYTDMKHARHRRVESTVSYSPGQTIETVEAMATLSPVLNAAESLRKMAVINTFDCKLTAYGPGFASTGKHPGDPGYGITATGHAAKPRRTVAVDPSLIPLGSLVYIDGVGYRIAEDVGGAIKGPHIDVFFADDNDAKVFGVKRHVKVFVFAQSRGRRTP
ncbi:MAG: 3D domain-containing protein [Bacilli bacterium]